MTSRFSTEDGPRNCGDCGAKPGELHDPGCDVERCPDCGGQAISCRHRGRSQHHRLPWTGIWPGELECIEFGWFSRMTDRGWERCKRNDERAGPDLNRLHTEAHWDAEKGRFVKRD